MEQADPVDPLRLLRLCGTRRGNEGEDRHERLPPVNHLAVHTSSHLAKPNAWHQRRRVAASAAFRCYAPENDSSPARGSLGARQVQCSLRPWGTPYLSCSASATIMPSGPRM